MSRASLTARWPGFWVRLGGPLLTLVLIAVIEWLASTPLRAPNPPAFLVLAIVFSAFNGGLWPGLVSALFAWAYIAYYFSEPGQPFQYTDDNLRRVLVWAVTMPLMAFMVGLLNRRATRAQVEAEVATLRQAQLEERARAEAAVRDLSERLTHLLAASPTVLYALKVVDGDATIPIWISENITRLLGYTVDEALHPNWWLEHLHPDDRPRAMEALAHLLTDDFRHEYRFVRKDGTLIWLHDEHRLLRDQDGNPAEVVGTWTDITERKRAELALRESEELYRLLTDSSTDLIGLMDFEGNVLFVSPSVCQIMGLDPAQVVGLNAFDFIHPEDAPTSRAAWARALAGETVTFVHRAQHMDGSWRWLDGWGRVVQFLNQPRVLTVSRDMTERVRTQEALHRRVAELEAVARISAVLRTAQTLGELLPVLLDETLAALDSEVGVIWLYHSEYDHLRVAVARGWFERLKESPIKPGEGIAGKVFASGQAHLSREFASDPLTRPSAIESIPKGWGGICVPVHAAAEVVGVLFVSVPLPREITPEAAKLLTSLAEIAGTALHRLRLHEQTVRRLENLQALQTVDRAITASLDSRITLNTLLAQVSARLGVDAAGVLLFNPQSLTLEYAAGRGFRTRNYERSRLRLGEGLAGRAALERRLIRATDVRDAPSTVRGALLRNEGFTTYAAVPFLAKGHLKGILEVFHRSPLHADAEWHDFLETLAQQAAIAIDNIQLFESLQRSNLDLTLAYDATIEGWSRALDLRDRETEGHTQRVTELTLRLARAAGMTDEEVVHVRRGALLHDIGKMGIPDAILLKPDKLTDDEWAIMRQHPTYAYELLSPIVHLRPALDIPYGHHEKWDGSGYPRGLKGDQIPLAARLFAVVDVWDALRSDRPYRKAWPEDKVWAHLRAQAGTHFDPHAVELFFRVIAEA